MERKAREFRSAAGRLLSDKPRRGACYPEKLKKLALAALSEAEERGLGATSVARELGIHADTLRSWRDAASPATALVPVRVIESRTEQSSLVVIAAGGLRIEGLDIAGLAELIRRLA